MPSSVENGVVAVPSAYPIAQTIERLSAALTQAGMTIFATIDQQAAARDAGIEMDPMVLLVFGNPRGGTPLMQRYPTLAIDLPLKALAWQDGRGGVWVSTNDPAYLQQRHGLDTAAFGGVPALLERAVGTSGRPAGQD